jgi:hypothetical protein
VGLNSLKSLNLTNGYPNKNNKNKNNNNKVKSKPLELRSWVKSFLPTPKNVTFSASKLQVAVFLSFLQQCPKLFK